MKLLKFDTFHPAEYIKRKIEERKEEIDGWNFPEFHNWLISLRVNFSDFYTYNLTTKGWEAKEVFLENRIYQKKIEKYYLGRKLFLFKLFFKIRNRLKIRQLSYTEQLIKKIIEYEKPDVLFIREESVIRSEFWELFKDNILIVSRISCQLPAKWTPRSFDLIYTDIPSYASFFQANKIPTLANYNGFDQRILNEIKLREKEYDVTFIGGLGNPIFNKRTMFLEKLLTLAGESFEFSWWGYKAGKFDTDFPELNRRHKGLTAGIEMFQVYANSKIVLNDYGDVAGGTGVNQRIYEVMGVGTFLLTRESDSLKEWDQFIGTYCNEAECLEKILYFLKNPGIREQIAQSGQNNILENYSYENLLASMSKQLVDTYNQKFGTNVSI